MKTFRTLSMTVVGLAALVAIPGAAGAKPPKGHSKPPPPSACTVTAAEATIAAFETSPRGGLHGFTLDNGTNVKFPPHEASRVDAIVDPGSPVRVEGCAHTSPTGNSHHKASAITNTATGQSVIIG